MTDTITIHLTPGELLETGSCSTQHDPVQQH